MNANETMLWTAPTFRPVIPRVAFREVLVAQMWMLWDGRRIVILVGSLGLAMFIPIQSGEGMMPFMAGIHVTVLLAAALWGAVVWHAQEPGRRMEHREMPVGFLQHDLARVLAGFVLFAGAYGLIALLSAFDPGPWTWPQNGSWLHLFGMGAGIVSAYLLGSAAGIGVKHPIAALSLFAVGYIFFWQFLQVVLERPARQAAFEIQQAFGIEYAMVGPVALESHGRWSNLTYAFWGPDLWLKSTLLWLAVCTLLFLLALRLRRA